MGAFESNLKSVKQAFVCLDYVESIVEDINTCHSDSKLGGEADCMLVTGDSGAGKSTLIKYYRSKFPNQVSPSQTKIPVFFTSFPEDANRISAAQCMLSELGCPLAFSSNNPHLLKKRLITLLRQCETELVIIDEFQHLIESKSQNVLLQTADWLKDLIAQTNIPFVLFGMPYSSIILKSRRQLATRFMLRRHISPFFYEGEHSSTYFDFLRSLDEGLPFETLSGLTNRDIALPLHIVSQGNMRRLRKVINHSARFALENGHSKIERSDLTRATDKLLENDPDFNVTGEPGQHVINPFAHKEELRVYTPPQRTGWEDYITPQDLESDKEKNLNAVF